MPRFRHSAVLIDDIMLIFGGNSHNESTAQQVGCYSSLLLAYDTGFSTLFGYFLLISYLCLVCKSWMKLHTEEIAYISRYGHSAVVAADDSKNTMKMFVFGGFSGTARHDVIKFTPTCKLYHSFICIIEF